MQATLYQSKIIVPLNKSQGTYCNWLTKAITENNMIKIDYSSKVQVNVEGVVIRKAIDEVDPTMADRKQFLYPSTEQVIWNLDVSKL